MIPRMRTIKEAVAELKELDSGTAIHEYFVRSLVNENKIPFVRAGRKILINLDGLLEYLNQPEPKEGKPPLYGTIRRVSFMPQNMQHENSTAPMGDLVTKA